MDLSLILAGAALLGLAAFGIALGVQSRTPPAPPPPPQQPSEQLESYYELRTRLAGLERQLQDLEQTVERRHKVVTGMIAQQKQAAETPEDAGAQMILENLAGGDGSVGGGEAGAGKAPGRRRLVRGR